MIPRDRINSRKNLYMIFVAVGFTAMVVLAFTEKYIRAETFKVLLYCSIFLFLAGNILMYVGILCPKCKAILGYHIVFSAGKADRCPRCGSGFDKSIP